MKVWKVAVVGGGPGGLFTAHTLQKTVNAPMRISIFEASDRFGGKILTKKFKSVSLPYEAGAAEFYDYSIFDADPLKDLISEVGLQVRPMGGPAVVLDGVVLGTMDKIEESVGARAADELLVFDRQAHDLMTPLEFYHSDFPDGSRVIEEIGSFEGALENRCSPFTRRYVESFIHSDLATEPSQTSLTYGLHNYLMNDAAYMNLYGIVGGNESLPRELVSRFDGEKLLEHRVLSVRSEEKKFALESVFHDERREEQFDFVVLALPHNQLLSIEFPEVELAQAMRKHWEHYNFPAHYLRISILFKTPFWRRHFEDSYWMLDTFGGCCLYDESSRLPECNYGILGWLIGGAEAVEKSRLSDEQLIELVLENLPPFLITGREQFVEGIVHRWIGAVSALPGGTQFQPLDRRHSPALLSHPGLFVVGDYLFDSTINGVLDSAEFVASSIAAVIEERSYSNF